MNAFGNWLNIKLHPELAAFKKLGKFTRIVFEIDASCLRIVYYVLFEG